MGGGGYVGKNHHRLSFYDVYPTPLNLTVLFSLERAGMLFRLDEKIVPTRNRLATVSSRELGQLSKVKNIIRKGRLKAVTGVALLFK